MHMYVCNYVHIYIHATYRGWPSRALENESLAIHFNIRIFTYLALQMWSIAYLTLKMTFEYTALNSSCSSIVLFVLDF